MSTNDSPFLTRGAIERMRDQHEPHRPTGWPPPESTEVPEGHCHVCGAEGHDHLLDVMPLLGLNPEDPTDIERAKDILAAYRRARSMEVVLIGFVLIGDGEAEPVSDDPEAVEAALDRAGENWKQRRARMDDWLAETEHLVDPEQANWEAEAGRSPEYEPEPQVEVYDSLDDALDPEVEGQRRNSDQVDALSYALAGHRLPDRGHHAVDIDVDAPDQGPIRQRIAEMFGVDEADLTGGWLAEHVARDRAQREAFVDRVRGMAPGLVVIDETAVAAPFGVVHADTSALLRVMPADERRALVDEVIDEALDE